MLSPTATLMMRVPCCVLYSFAKSIAAMSLPAVVCSRCQAAEEVDTTEKNMETSTNATGRGAQHTKRENSR